jgi:plastocyanin
MNRILLVFCAFMYTAVFAGNVTGKVNFGGTPPKRDAIKMNADPKCAKANEGKQVLNDVVVVNDNKTLADVFVYVKEGVKTPPPADTTPVTFDQRACMYIPHVVALRVGQPLKILNSDNTMHNVHSLSKSNPGFNNAMPTQGQVIEKKFAKPETMIRVKCDVHTWMNAFINVMEHPYYAVSDNKGGFTIKDLPAGEYTLEAVHGKLGAKTAKVKVTDAGITQDFAF